ncbi:MAG: recombinase family protein [Dietzia psychralcaliphila]
MTTKQYLDQQTDALEQRGVGRIFTDKWTGRSNDRPGLQELLECARPGDTLVVVALDRLGHSLTGIIETICGLQQRGICLVSLRENLDITTPTGKMMASIFAALAEYEVDHKAERATAAREAAAARGRHTGRPRSMTNEQIALAKRMKESGESAPTIAATFGVSKATVYRTLERT